MRTLMKGNEFNNKLQSFYDQGKKLGPMLQELIEDALLQASPASEGGHGSTARLTKIIQVCAHVKTVPTRDIQRYIQEHAEVTWTKNDDGSRSFKWRDKPSVTMPTETWFEWKKNQANKDQVDVNVAKSLKLLMAKSQKEGAVVKDDEGLLPELRELLNKHNISWGKKGKNPAAFKAGKEVKAVRQ